MTCLIVDAQRKFLGRIGHCCRISEAVNRQAACSLSDYMKRGKTL